MTERPTVRHLGQLSLILMTLFATLSPSRIDAQDCDGLVDGEIAIGSWLEVDRLDRPRTAAAWVDLGDSTALLVGGSDVQSLNSTRRFDFRSGRFSEGPQLSLGRGLATAIVLTDGRVWIAGGETGNPRRPTETTELYDPATGSLVAGASMGISRYGHTATPLLDGRVLVVGGWTSDGPCDPESCPTEPTASTELFDPQIGPIPLPDLDLPRRNHTATRLADGRVMVIGGAASASSRHDSVRIFEPASGQWAEAPSLLTGRSGHRTVVLDDGRVMVIGGLTFEPGDPEPLATTSTELYDPDSGSGSWSPGPDLAQARWHFVAHRLPDGRVVVASGRGDDACPEPLGVEIYDPDTDAFAIATPLADPRTDVASLSSVVGRPLLAGGRNDDQQQLATAFLFAAESGASTAGPELLQARKATAAVLLPNGQVLVAGGRTAPNPETDDPGSVLGTAEVYDPSSGLFQAIASESEARTAATLSVLHDGRVAWVGGKGVDSGSGADLPLRSVDLYDPTSNTFQQHADVLQHGRWSHTATTLVDGSLLVCGGSLGAGLGFADSCERISFNGGVPISEAIVLHPDRPWFRHSATPLADGRVLLTGGVDEDEATYFNAEIYDPFGDTLIDAADMTSRRRRHTSTTLADGRVLVTGGNGGTRSAEMYDPVGDVWTPLPDLDQAFNTHVALPLADGTVVMLADRGHEPLIERFDPAVGDFTVAGQMLIPRHDSATVPLVDGRLLTLGGVDGANVLTASELFMPTALPIDVPLPQLDAVAGTLDPIDSWTLHGSGLWGSGTHGGQAGAGEARLHLTLRSLSDGRIRFLTPRSVKPTTVVVAPPAETDDPPPPGFHLLTPVLGGRIGPGIIVELSCGFALGDPEDREAELGQTATFEVVAPGARAFQWQRSTDGGEHWTDLGTVDLGGAHGSSYQTPPVLGADHGSLFRVLADAGCAQEVSAPAELRVTDSVAPEVAMTRPAVGEVWVLSSPEAEPNSQVITWSAFDDLPLVEQELTLEWTAVDGMEGDQPLCLNGGCSEPQPADRDLVYHLPSSPPGGIGARYRIRIRVTDVADNAAEAVSPDFVMVAEDPTRKTLLITHRARLADQFPGAELSGELDRLFASLGWLAAHPRVQGVIVDLGQTLGFDSGLLDIWDEDPADPARANAVLFADDGVQDVILSLASAYPALEYLVIVGHDGILPFARAADATPFLIESDYLDPARGEPGSMLDAEAVPGIVGALAANRYLTDDPLGVLEDLSPEDLDDPGILALPDLAVGRLVEHPAAMADVVDRFLDHDGILPLDEDDLGAPPARGVAVAGYDFLSDVAQRVASSWQDLAVGAVHDELAGGWDPASVEAARDDLHGVLTSGRGVYGLFGHADHTALGVPGVDRFDIQGLSVLDLTGTDDCGNPGSRPALDLDGALVYAVGCHGALSVPGSCADVASYDLPEVVLESGALAYIANTGYGWGLLFGVGYAERLVELFSLEPRDGPISIGQAVRRAKINYWLQDSRLDPFDLKTLQQWTLFGLPMVELRTPSTDEPSDDFFGQDANDANDGKAQVEVEERVESAGDPGSELPPGLVRVSSDFQFDAEGVYRLFDTEGVEHPPAAGCPSEDGCYFTLNGLSSGESDRPVEPYFIYEALLAGTRPQGVLWLGGSTSTTTPWHPIVGRPASNEGSEIEIQPGALPRTVVVGPIPTYLGDGCGSGIGPLIGGLGQDVGRLLVHAGATIYASTPIPGEPPPPAAHHRFLDYQIETFYHQDGGCGQGPTFESGPFDGEYHQRDAAGLSFAVPVHDEDGVWRVVVVWTTDAELPDSEAGFYYPLELEREADGLFHGQIPDHELTGSTLTFVLQAVDVGGAVRVLEGNADTSGIEAGAGSDPSTSGIDPRLALTVDVDLESGGAPPSLREVRAVPGNQPLTHGMGFEPALARLDVELSVPVDTDADLRLIPLQDGMDPQCADDPEPWPALVLGGPTAESVSLHLGNQPPPAGAYRFLICDLRDSLGTPLPETAIDFHLTADHLLQNGGFDQGLDSWSTTGFARFVDADASGALESYSLLLPVGSGNQPSASQCTVLEEPLLQQPHLLTAMVRTSGCEGASVSTTLTLESFADDACQGSPAPIREVRGLFVDPPAEPETYPHDTWVELRGLWTPSADSAGVRLSLTATSDRSCEVWIDEVQLYPSPGGIFFDGFEQGSVDGWSDFQP